MVRQLGSYSIIEINTVLRAIRVVPHFKEKTHFFVKHYDPTISFVPPSFIDMWVCLDASNLSYGEELDMLKCNFNLKIT